MRTTTLPRHNICSVLMRLFIEIVEKPWKSCDFEVRSTYRPIYHVSLSTFHQSRRFIRKMRSDLFACHPTSLLAISLAVQSVNERLCKIIISVASRNLCCLVLSETTMTPFSVAAKLLAVRDISRSVPEMTAKTRLETQILTKKMRDL